MNIKNVLPCPDAKTRIKAGSANVQRIMLPLSLHSFMVQSEYYLRAFRTSSRNPFRVQMYNIDHQIKSL